MSKSGKLQALCLFGLSLFLFSFTQTAFGQAIFVSARHETINQRQLDVTFDRAVASGAPSIVGWTIQVNGTNVPFVNQGNFGPNTIRFQFDASAIAGHGGTQAFLKPGETLRVSFAGGGGINAFGFQNSQNNFVFNCGEMIFFKQEAYASVDVCSPVVMNFTQYVYRLSLRFRNSSAFNLANIFYNVSWGDAAIQNFNPYISDISGVANPTFIDDTGFTGSNPAVILTSRPTHNYPAANPTDCSFNFSLTPFVNLVANCPSITTTTLFATYDTDNANSGTLSMPPSVAGSNLVCLGNNVNMRFTDATSLNCRAAIEPIVPNDQARHIRIVYGSQNLGTNIPDIRVGGTPVTSNNAAGTHLFAANPVLGGGPGYVPTGAGGIGVPDFNGVIQLATPVSASTATAFMQLITTTSTTNHVVGDRFYVRLEYWDICNPYNAGNPASPAPVTIENFVEIITSPNPPTVNNPSVCESTGTGSYNITANGVGGGTLTYTWYLDAGLTTVLQGPNTDNTFNPVTEGPVGNRINNNVAVSTTFNRYVTVTQSSNNCTSQPQTITIRIDALNTGGTIAHPLGASPQSICNTDDPVAFTSTLAGTGGGPLGTFTYQWQNSTAAGGPFNNIAGATSATYDPTPAVIATGRFFRRQTISGLCANANSNVFEFQVDTPVTGGAIGNPQTICTGGNPAVITNVTTPTGGNGTYSYLWQEADAIGGPYVAASGTNNLITYDPPVLATTKFYRRLVTSGVCAPGSALSNVIEITVDQVVVPGVINNPQTICSGQDPAILGETTPPSGGNGSTYTFQWQESATGGGVGFAAAPGVNTGATYDPPVLTATRFYRRRVTSGVCPPTFSNEIQITVNALPTVNISGGGSICSGTPAPDVVFTFTGAGPWDMVYSINGVNQPAVNNTTSPFSISNPPAGTYAVVSITDSNTPNCTVTAPSPNITGTAVVTIQAFPPPTVDSFTAQPPVCDDGGGTNPPDAILDLAPDAIANYAITYRLFRVSTASFLPGSINFTGNSNGSGIINLAPTYAQFGAVPADPQGYQVVITAIQNTGTQCAGAVPINGPILIINPRPAVPTGAVPGTACSTDATGAPISVTAPPVGFTIVWSSTAAPTFTAAAGVTGGTRGNTFTPTSNATVTYHAFTRDDINPTNCLSATSLPVVHTQDVAPTASVAGGAQANCTGTFTLTGNLPNAGLLEVGTWTIPGIAYQQLFTYANGTTTSAAVNGWSRDVSGAGVFAGGSGSFQVNGNQFEATNTDGSGAGGAEVVWLSPVINIATMPGLSVSLNLSSTATHEGTDYIRVFTKLDGGPEVLLPTNGNNSGNITGTITASAAGLTGTTLQLIVRASNSAADETYRFDNILIAQPTGPTVTDINNRTATVTGLPVGANVLTWTISSRYGVCTPSSSNVTLTRNPLPAVNNLTPTLCEDLPGGTGATSNVNLSALYDVAVMGGTPANTVVEYYSNAARTILISTPITATNGLTVFTRVRNTVTTCTNDGTIVFTVRPLPAKTNQTVQVCEDFPPGSNQRTGINLQSFETAAAGGSMVNRDIEWYEDAGLTLLIPPGVASGAEQNYSINADKTIHAKIIDTASPTTPQCFSQATLTLDYQARPNNNQITDGIGQMLGATYTVCASSNLVLLQINPGLNPGSTYIWTVPPPAYVGEFELLTGTTGFFIILRFPNPIASPGIPITVKETLGTALCDGNTLTTNIIVEGSPPQPIISGPSSVCSNANGVVFSVTNPVAGTYSWSLPAGATITSLPVTASSITVQMSTFSGNVTVTHASGTGCTSPAAVPFPVTVINRPTITSVSTATLCSGQNVNAVHTITSNIVGTTYDWEVINITGSVLGTLLGNTATGVTDINETLSNTSGVTATVTYRITPIGPGPDNCPGTPQNFTVTVNPEPVIVAGQTKTICSGAAAAKEIILAPANLPAGTLFNWPDPDGAGPATAGVNIPMGVAGTIHINDVLTNLTNAPITVNYVVTPTSGASCIGVAQTVSIIVNPQPVGANDATPIVCSGVAAGYNLQNNIATLGNNLIAGTTYSWVATANAAVSGESTSAQSGATITDVLRNITTSNQVVRYTVTPSSGAGCVGAAFLIDITVRPEPVGFNDASPVICSDANVNYNLVSNIANTGAGGNNLTVGTTYSWVAAANPFVTGESTAPVASSVISDVINNITNSSQVVVYTVTPTSQDGCVGAPFTVSVTVRPEPKGHNDLTPIICSDAAVNYNIEANILNTGLGGNGLISGTTYAWVATPQASVAGEGSGTGSTITDVLNNITNVNQVVTYTVTATSADGCVGDPFTVSVTVRPEPRGFNDVATICSDGTVNYSLSGNIANTGAGGNNLTAGTTYSWIATANPSVLGESTSAQASATITDVLNNITNANQVVTYTVTPTSVNGCVGDPFTVLVTVQPEPKGYNDATPITCSDVALAYDLSTNIANTGAGGNNLTAGTTYSWVAAANATVTGESTTPQTGGIINDVINNITNANQTVVYTVTPTSAAGCVGDPFTVTVTVRPEPRGFDDNSPVVCSDVALAYSLSANIANTGAGGNNLAIGTTYSWIATPNANVLGESTSAQTGATINDVLNNITAGNELVTYTVTPTSADGCVGNPFTVTVTVRPEPKGFNDVATVCSDVAVGYDLVANIANTGAGGNNLTAGTTYSWVAANNASVGGESILPQTGSTITDVLNNITNTNQVVTYTVTPTSSNGCVGNAFTVTVTVQPEPKGFNDTAPIVCSGATVNYDLSANVANTGAGGNNLIAGTTYSWIAADNINVSGESLAAQAGTTITDVLVNITNGNEIVVYTVTPTSASGCVGNPFTVSVNVRPEPKGFNDNTPSVCSDVAINYDLVANITNTASGGNNLAVGTTYSWIAADNPSTTGESLTAQAGAIITNVVTNITNVNQVVVYTVTPTSINGCVGDPFTVSVTIRPEPKGFNDATPIICSDASVAYSLSGNIANTGAGGNNLTAGTTYSWVAASNIQVGGESTTPQTGATITDVLNNITNANQQVIYTVTPTSASGCVGNPFTVTVTVRPEPQGYNDATPVICSDAAVNYDLSTNIANTGLGGNNLVTGTTYSWIAASNTFVNGESTSAQTGAIITDVLNNITNANQVVVYTVTPTSADGCVGNPFTVSVTVRPEPVGFNDNSPVTCSDVALNYDLVANISNVGLGGNSLVVGTTYSWVAADNPAVTGESTTPQTGSVINNTITNISNANEQVVYTVTPTSINGCVGNPFTVTVTVRPEPKGFNDTTPITCSDVAFNYDLTTNIANTGAGGNNLVAGTTYSWVAAANAFVAGESTSAQSGAIITDVLNNITNINQTVTYTVTPTSALGCVGNPFTVQVTVRPEPKGYNDTTPIICSDAVVNYDLMTNVGNTGLGGNNLVAGTTYSWIAASNINVGGESTVAQAGSIITDALNNITNTNQIVVYTVTPTSAFGCVGDPFTVSVTVRPEPRGFNDATPVVCSDAAINYNLANNIANTGSGGNNLVAGTTYSWIAADNPSVTGESTILAGTTSTITDVVNNITNTDQVVVYTITPTSSDGCVGDPFTVSVTIRPEPKGFNDPAPLACSDVAFNYDLAANIANTGAGGNNLVVGTTYSWVATPNAFVTGEGSGTGSIITDVINNITNATQIVTYTITPTSAQGCAGNPFTVSINVRPEPRGFTDNTPVICSDASVGYDLAANIANTVSGGNNLVTGTTYSWIAAANANVGGESTGAQTGNTITDVLNNITNVNQVVVYTVTPTSANGCVGDPFIVSVTVRPEPRGFDDVKTICSDANVNYDLTANIGNTGSGGNNLLVGTTYSWIAANNPSVTGESFSTPGTTPTITDVLNNITNSDQLVVYTVTPTSNNGCVGDPFTVTVTVRPEPKGFNDTNPIICSDANVNYDLTANIANTGSGGNNLVAGTTYSWVAASNPSVSGESTSAQTGALITDVLNNITNANQIVVYTITPTSSFGCVGDPFTVSVTVRPEPKGFNDTSPVVCSDVNVNYDLTTNIANTGSGGNNLVAGTTYSWQAADNPGVTGETLVLTNTSVINDVLNNVTGSNQVVVYTITPTSANGCVGDPFTVSVTVRPEPVGLADTDAVCSDEAISYNIQTRNINLLGNSVASQFTYTVVSSDPANVSVAGKNRTVANAAPITDTYTNTTSADVLITYTITPFSTTGTCPGTPFDVVITIHPEPLGPNTTIQRCSDDPVNFDLQDVIDTPVTGNSVPSKFRYTVTSNNPLAVAPGPNRNTATPAPIADVYTNTTNADVDITYTVTPISLADDCEGSPFTLTVVVHPEPVGANVVDPVCSTTLNYNIQTQNINALGNGVASVFTYTVASSDAINVPPAANRVVASNLPITDAYVNSTGVDVTITYTITPISAANGCAGTPFTYAVTISSKPVGADVTKANVCSDVPFSFNPQADITNGVIATFTWTAVYQPGLTVGGFAPPASGTGIINGSLTNTGNSTLNATYTIIPTAGTCVGDPFTITVPILPEPVVATNLNAIVCSGDPYNTLLNTNGVSVGAANYDVTAVVDAGLTGTPTTGLGLSANALLNDAFTNVTAIPLKVTYTVTPHGTNGCVGDPKVVELTVNPEPVINPALDNTVCSREISGIILSTNGTSVAANSYRLVSVTVPGTITADPLNTTAGTVGNINLIRNDKFTNTTNAAVIVVYEIVGISPAPASCEGQPEFINLTVNPEPILQPGTASLCSDIPSGIIVGPAAGSATITDYELKSIVKAPALVAGGSNAGLGIYPANLGGGQSNFLANDVFTNTTAGPLTVTYTVAPIASGCRGVDQTIVFTVNPAPALDDNLNRIVCSDEIAGIVFATETSPASPAAVSYNIVSINVPGGLVRTAGNATFPRTGVTASDIQLDQFRNPTNNPLVVTYTVQGVSGAPCTGPTRDILLTVEPEVVAAPVNNAPTICSGDQTDIDLISPTNPTLGGINFNYTAVSSVGGLISGFVPSANNLPENYKIEDALVNNSDNPATVTYTISAVANGAKNGGGCSSLPPAVTVVVTVEPKPKLVATPAIQTVCEGVATSVTLNSNTVPSAGNVQFELLSATATGGVTGMSAVGTLFNPGSSLADVLSNPTTTTQSVTYTFQPRIIGGLGCVGDNVVVTISVNPLPTIVASAQPDICSGDFINITLTPDVTNTIAQWTVSAPATVTGASNGAGNLIFQTLFSNGNIPETVTYTVTPRANNCNGTPIVINVVVNPKPKFVGLPTTTTVCHGQTLNVPLTSTVAGTTFDWVVDDPSGLGVPATGSGNVINQVLTNTTGSQASLTYTITPTGPGACLGDQKILIVTVSPQMDATFLNTNSSICKGTSEFLIFELQGQAPFRLVYNDGTSDITVNNSGNVKVIQVTPTVTTTYTIKSIRDALGCDFLPVNQSVTVTVGETDATFSIVGPTASCGPYDATFQFNQVAGTEYTWQWFDGSPDDVFLATTTVPNQTITHTFTNPNPNAAITYKVTLRTQLPAPFPGCFKSSTLNVTVYPTIITNAFPDRSEICSGESIQFFNQSFGVSAHRWFYRVQGTTNEIDVRTTPTTNYTFINTTTTNPIIYEVVYQATNGNCPAPDVVIPITVYRGIIAGFDEGTIPPFVGGNSTVTFTNTSNPLDVGQFRYVWDFGLNSTPGTGTGAGPIAVNYSTPGPRDVSIHAVNIAAENAGLTCDNRFSKTINIPVLPLVAAFVAEPQRVCFPSDITVTQNTSTGDVMDWRVVDSNGRIAATSNAVLPVFRITTPGEYSIFLTTSNSATGQVANTQQGGFEVFDNPVASFDLRPTLVYVPDTELTTFNFSLGATDYIWDFGDGGTSTETEPVYIYKVEGAYDVTLIAQNDHGQGVVCSDTLVRQVTAKQGGVTKVPNAFTPNPSGPSGGGGIGPGSGGNGTFNDEFLPIVKGAEEFNMQIFDRWGNLIFESNNSNVGWDGYDRNGKLMPAGVYVYKLTIRLSDGQRATQIGDVTMIR